MIYIASVHYGTNKWMNIQLKYIKKYITIPFRLFMYHTDCGKIPPHIKKETFFIENTHEIDHGAKLNKLGNEITRIAESDDDVIVFLDSDAWPISNKIVDVLKSVPSKKLIAVRRDDNDSYKFPHPCFCAITVGTWKTIQGDWRKGNTVDVGCVMAEKLIQNKIKWTPIFRTNVYNPHPVLFGIYGDIVYHHGAGCRSPKTRVDLHKLIKMKILRRSPNMELPENLEQILNEMSDKVYSIIENDDDFHNMFMGNISKERKNIFNKLILQYSAQFRKTGV